MAFQDTHSRLLVQFHDRFGLPEPDPTGTAARAWTRKLAEQFAFSFPGEGWGTKAGGGGRPASTDVICTRDPFIGYDTIQDAGIPSQRLIPHPDPLDLTGQEFIAVTATDHLGTGVAGATCRLGASLFWLLAGRKKYPDQLRSNLAWIAGSLQADFVRAFGVLGGDLFDGRDPWSDVGASLAWPDYDARIAEATDYVFDTFGLRVMWTLVGSRFQVHRWEQQEALVDRFARMARPRTHKIELFEMWNEYRVNGGTASELRNMARRLRDQLPADVPIALSSPDSVMGESPRFEVLAEVEEMHGWDSGANALTYHPSRAEGTVWAPGADLGPHAPRLRGNTEPRGPGASAGGNVDDPTTIASDYAHTRDAGWAWYVFHTMPGVWGGHCDPAFPQQNHWSNLFDVPNASAIASALRAVKAGGTGGGDTGGGTGGDDVKPYPDENSWWLDYSQEVIALWEKAGRHDLVALLRADPRALFWFARMGHSSAHADLEVAKRKHLTELADELGVSR